MKLRDTLVEGISPVVYHSTSVPNIISILQQNAIRMRPYVGQPAEAGIGKPKKLFFLSTARSKRGGYVSGNDFTGVFVLDGRKLAQKYKGSPVEYWDKASRDVDRERRTTEMEDRIYGDKPTIPNAKKYITALHIKLPDGRSEKENRRIRDILMVTKKSGIPTYFYRSKNDFLNQNKAKAEKIDIKSLKDAGKREYPKGGSDFSKRMAMRDLAWIVELYKKKPGQKLSKEADKMRAAIVYREYDRHEAGSLAGDAISSTSRENLPIVNKVVQIMQKLNFTKTHELINYLTKKWTPEGE